MNGSQVEIDVAESIKWIHATLITVHTNLVLIQSALSRRPGSYSDPDKRAEIVVRIKQSIFSLNHIQLYLINLHKNSDEEIYLEIEDRAVLAVQKLSLALEQFMRPDARVVFLESIKTALDLVALIERITKIMAV